MTDEKVFKCDSIRKHRWLMKVEKSITSLWKYAKKVNSWEQLKKILKYLLNSLLKIWLKSIMKEKLSELKKNGDNDWQLQFGNDPKHKSKLAIDFLKKKTRKLILLIGFHTLLILILLKMFRVWYRKSWMERIFRHKQDYLRR